MKLSAYCFTDQGGRDHNEDSVRCLPEEGIFVAADGLGGHRGGEVASALAAELIVEGCRGEKRNDLLSLLLEANSAVLSARGDMKTTAVVLTVTGKTAAWAHVGDTRLYRYTGGQFDQVTRDHSVSYMKYLTGEISYEAINHDEDRARLIRALGQRDCKPEAGQGPCRAGDAFLLCTDGFWEYVSREEMLAELLRSKTPEEWALGMLTRHALVTPPDNDNFSLIAVFVEE